MIDIKDLTEEQQAKVYKMLSEAALRVFCRKSDISVEVWKKIYEFILMETGVKVRKIKEGLRIKSNITIEDVRTNTSNISYRDSIARWINEIDNGSDDGNYIIRQIYHFTKSITDLD